MQILPLIQEFKSLRSEHKTDVHFQAHISQMSISRLQYGKRRIVVTQKEKYKEEETSEKMKRDVNERHKCKHTET